MKKSMLICAPVTSRSGYGAHARDLVTSLIEHDKYDIKILDVPWGECPRNALNKNDSNDKEIFDRILTGKIQINQKPDIYIDIRIPNEFQQIGQINIGITAGVETSAVSQAWIDGCNKMDLIIVPSEHSKFGFINSKYDKMKQTGSGEPEKIGELKLEKPIEVLFEGADEDIYKPLSKDEIDSEFFDWLNDEVPEKFAFLSVGQWTQGDFGEDRKDIGTMVKTFYESFANKKKQPALILKTSGATYSIMDKETCLDKLKGIKSMFPSDWKLPNVYLFHGDLSNKEMNMLYNHPKVKAMVSFTHGEGFGRPMLEFSMIGKPLMVSGWSGHLDFLDKDLSLLVPGKLQKIPKSMVWENILIEESQWFYIDVNTAYRAFNMLNNDIEKYTKQAKELLKINKSKFTLNKMSKKLDKLMDELISKLPKQVELQLPKLKKVKETI